MQIIIFPLMKIRVKNNFTLIIANSATFFIHFRQISDVKHLFEPHKID